MLGFYFDAPTSITSSAHDKAHRRRSTPSGLPSSQSRRKSTSDPSSESFLGSLIHRIPCRVRRSPPIPSTLGSNEQPSTPTPSVDSLFFRLPLELRQKIYGYIVGQGEVLHILMKRKASCLPYGYGVAYRRCRAGGNIEDCIMKKCREFLDVAEGVYFGSFDRVGGLLLTSRDIYKEASLVLYNQNTLDFDHPLSLIIFSRKISQSSLHSIRSLSFEVRKHLHVQKPSNPSQCSMTGCKSFHPYQWVHMWDIIANMPGLEEVRVRFRSPFPGWMGWTAKDVLDPLWKVTRPLKVFDVASP